MKSRLSVVILLVGLKAHAITWHFDSDGNTEGWFAQRDPFSGVNTSVPRYPSEVTDGVWRIPLPSSSVELVSPAIGRDSGLFDRLSIRARVVHIRPVERTVSLRWTNETNRHKPAEDPARVAAGGLLFSRFVLGFPHVYTTGWQEIVFGDLRTRPVLRSTGDLVDILWEGELIDIRVKMALGDKGIWPEALEVDRIVLTGVEEQLQGELAPPGFTPPLSFGELFEEAVFHSLGTTGIQDGVLGDVDGDGDADVVASWMGDHIGGDGWLLALNGGARGFVQQRRDRVVPNEHGNTPIPYIFGADVDANGLLDPMVTLSNEIRIYRYDEDAGGLRVHREFEGDWPRGLGDADGDGDVDLWTRETGSTERPVMLIYLNDGQGRFAPPIEMALASHPGFRPGDFVRDLPGGVQGVVWFAPLNPELEFSALNPEEGLVVSYFGDRGETMEEFLDARIDLGLAHYIGDYDRDGDIDLVVSDAYIQDNLPQSVGLKFMFNRGDGSFETVDWLEDARVLYSFGPSRRVTFVDLNGDDVLDPVFVDSDPVNPAVITSLGQRQALPIPEGRYPLPGRGGPVVSVDVDGDGRMDLAVLERALGGDGGLYILRRLPPGITAVVEATGETTPGIPYVGANYPNPFNPQTLIPFVLAADAASVQLRIYNVAGQSVRGMVRGPLPAGAHELGWDGRDDAGQAVSSGLYVYRIEAGAFVGTGKMVKSD